MEKADLTWKEIWGMILCAVGFFVGILAPEYLTAGGITLLIGFVLLIRGNK